MKLVGSVDQLPSGKWRFRMRKRGRKSVAEICQTEAEALESQRIATERAHNPRPLTLREYAPSVLEWRETELGYRSTKTTLSQWNVHIKPAAISALPLRDIRKADVKLWTTRLKGSFQTKKHALNLLRRILARAEDEQLIAENPAIGVRIVGKQSKKWTYLRPAEIERLTSMAHPYRWLIGFAIGTGLRQGEQWALRLADVHLDDAEPHVIVRFGGKNRPTKTGETRRVELFGLALECARAWVAHLPRFLRSPSGRTVYRNENALMFPSARGEYRRDKKPPREWARFLREQRIEGATGVKVVWHSLRHTCASMLVSGAWGRRWTLQEVAAMLGHESVETTERYAHLAEGALRMAAREHRGHGGVTEANRTAKTSRATLDSNQRPSAPEASENVVSFREVRHRLTPGMTALAKRVLKEVREGDPMALSTALRLAEMVLTDLDSDAVREAR